MNYWRSASKHARFANVPRTSQLVSGCQWNERDTCAVNVWFKMGHQWMVKDVRGFEPVPTHKHWRPTRVPRIVTHTRRKNKPPSTHIHLQSMTVHIRFTDELRIRRTLRAETKDVRNSYVIHNSFLWNLWIFFHYYSFWWIPVSYLHVIIIRFDGQDLWLV